MNERYKKRKMKVIYVEGSRQSLLPIDQNEAQTVHV